MLSQNNLSLLYQIISDDSQTFKKISENIKTIFLKENKSNIGTTLVLLLRDNLLNIHQRIISYYILFEISKQEKIISNLYVPIILEMLQKSQNKNEQIFLEDFLQNQINYLDITVQNYLKDTTKELKIDLAQLIIQWNKCYKDILVNKNIYFKANDKLRPIIYDRKKSDIKNIDNHKDLNLFNDNNNDNNIEQELNFNYYNPNYMSYYPLNNNNFLNSEPIWIIPQIKHNFIWEKKMNINEKQKKFCYLIAFKQ